MRNLSVRKLDEKIFNALKIKAAQHGVSMEEEVRQILSRAVQSPDSIADVARRIFGKHGIDDLVIPKRKPYQPMEFE